MTENLEGIAHISEDFSITMPGVVAAMSESDSKVSTVNEDALARRYSRFNKKKEGLVFEFTRDPALIHQYYRIYENEFKAVLNGDYHHSDNDEHDAKSHFLIIRRGKLCVGGARLSVKTPRQQQPLPIEMDSFKLNDYFPHLEEKQMRYGQIGRICLLPEFRGGDVTRMLLWHLYRKIVALDLDKIFGTATISNARVYRQSCLAMGLKDVKIHSDIELPVYPMCDEIKFYLISGSVDKALIKNKDIDHEVIRNSEEV